MASATGDTKKTTYKRKPLAPVISVSGPGRLRFAHLMALFGVSHQTIYSRIASGAIPPPDGRDGVVPYWFCASIRPLLGEASE